jgi:prepilin-type N-terminal cleavage/methylation domain-containing protein
VIRPPSTRAGLSARANNFRAFTLLEILVVMSIIAVLAVLVAPALTSMGKAQARKGALSSLLQAIEQARSLSMKDGVSTYLVFPEQITSSDPTVTQRYPYRSFAVFEDDAANPGTIKQITAWQTFQTGVSLRTGSLNYLAKTMTFPFTPSGQNATGSFPFLKFNPTGEVDVSSTPSATTGTIQFGIFEGYVDTGGVEHDTNSTHATDSIELSRLTGRAKRM